MLRFRGGGVCRFFDDKSLRVSTAAFLGKRQKRRHARRVRRDASRRPGSGHSAGFIGCVQANGMSPMPRHALRVNQSAGLCRWRGHAGPCGLVLYTQLQGSSLITETRRAMAIFDSAVGLTNGECCRFRFRLFISRL